MTGNPATPAKPAAAHRRTPDKQLQERFDTDITNFMDLVEASTRYPVREACLGEVHG